MKQQLIVLEKPNDWLLNYKGKTFTERLNLEISTGLFEEHAKKSSGYPRQIAKAVVYCLEPESKEILSLGGSCLLRDIKSQKIYADLILDHYGLWFQSVINNAVVTVKDDTGAAVGIRCYQPLPNFTVNSLGTIFGRIRGKMGSGSTAPLRADFKIETDLVSAPENGYLEQSGAGYTGANTIIYNFDASPTGGSGTVREAGTFGFWFTTGDLQKSIMLTRDAISATAFTAGKLLRTSYAWQI